MKRMLNAHFKKFTGAKYERFPKTAAVWVMVLFALRSSDFRLEIAPTVIWLTTVFITVSGFVQVLSSDDIVDSLRGPLMLPEPTVTFHAAFFLSVALYTLLTKTGLLLIAYLALCTAKASTIIGFAICFIAGGAITYPFAFRFEKKVTKYHYAGGAGQYARHAGHHAGSHAGHHFAVYLIRYLWNNKNYLVNTILMWAFGCVFAVFMSKSGIPNILPVGFALMCLNTPLGILLSGDSALYRQVRFLPRQHTGVLLPYALVVAVVNTVACALYLTVWYLVTGSFSAIMLLMGALFPIISALLTVMLEMKFPLLHWKTAGDLWHHPRKYIVPAAMVLFAGIVIILMGGF